VANRRICTKKAFLWLVLQARPIGKLGKVGMLDVAICPNGRLAVRKQNIHVLHRHQAGGPADQLQEGRLIHAIWYNRGRYSVTPFKWKENFESGTQETE
jgi:hypothetical protein